MQEIMLVKATLMYCGGGVIIIITEENKTLMNFQKYAIHLNVCKSVSGPISIN